MPLWLVVGALVLVLAACSGGEKLPLGALAEDEFKALITLEELRSFMTSDVALKTEFKDVKKLARSEDPEQVVNVDSAYGLTFTPDESYVGVALAALDFDSDASALDHFENNRQGPGSVRLEAIDAPAGASIASLRVDSRDLGSIVILVTGDRFASIHTVSLPVQGATGEP